MSDQRGIFPATSSALLGALSDDATIRRRSWDRLARAYHQPVYVHVRARWGKSEQEALDIVQGFFTRCLEKDTFAHYDPQKARFRTFLRTCLDRYVIDLHRRKAVRPVERQPLMVERDVAEAQVVDAEPEAAFDAAWTRRVTELARAELERHCKAKHKEEHLRLFERYHLVDGDPPSYAELAREAGLSVTDVTNRLVYARRHFRRLILEVLRDLTVDEREYREEARELLGIDL